MHAQRHIYKIYTIHLQNMTNIGHRFGHQLGLYESAGQIIVAVLNGFAFRVDVVFQQIKITYTAVDSFDKHKCF